MQTHAIHAQGPRSRSENIAVMPINIMIRLHQLVELAQRSMLIVLDVLLQRLALHVQGIRRRQALLAHVWLLNI